MALTKRYVRADAAGGGDGTTDANSGANGAFTLAEMITDLNTPHVGYKYLIKSGTYARTTNSVTLTGDGTTTSPIVIEGFNTTEGDLYAQGWANGGGLDTTNFPEITFTTGIFDASGSQYLSLRCLKIVSEASNYALSTTARFEGRKLHVRNNGTNAASHGISLVSSDATLIECDVLTAPSGGTIGVRSTASNTLISGCRIKCSNGSGVVVRGTVVVNNCTVYECGGVGISTDNVSTVPTIINNTIVNCGGDGIDIVTSSTNQHIAAGNHITGCGGYAIDFNTSTCIKLLGKNRFRDNTSGIIRGGGDWEEGTSVDNVTSDDTDALDFTDQSSDDYSLKSTAAAYNKGIGYITNIGANGTAAGGGGSLISGRLVR